MILLDIKNIRKNYTAKSQSIEVLKGVSLSLYQGEVLSLLGANGAGKTTLSHIIATLHPPTSGDILYKGTSIYDDIAAYRFSIGLCSQQSNLNPYSSVFNNLYYSALAYRFCPKDAVARVHEVIELLELQKYTHYIPAKLSGGYKQKVMLARTLLHRPSLIILDEPTVALDPAARQKVWQTIKMLRAQGTTIILTTHYLEEAEALADRVCILHEGSIKLVDTPENLKKNFAKKNLEDVFLALTAPEGSL